MKISLVKKSTHKGLKAAAKPHAGQIPVGFQLVDNEDATFVVNGLDAAGLAIDIGAVATLANLISSDTSVLTVDPAGPSPAGTTSAVHAAIPAKVGTSTVSFDVTWTDGSVGPFHVDWPIPVVQGAPGSVVVQPGTPVMRP